MEPAMLSSISVIICAHTEDRWIELVEAVRSVERQRLPASEIIVVIDYNDRLLARVREHLPSVCSIENDAQKGLSGSRNTGVSVTQSDIVAFLDDDAVAEPDWLKWLAAGYENERVFGVGGTIIPLWEDARPRWFPEEFDWVVSCSFRGMPQGREPVSRFIGANMSFRRKVFETLGGFRTDLGRIGRYLLSGEETELCHQIRRTWPDKLLLFEPRAQVLHRVSKQRETWRYFFSRCYAEGLSKARISLILGAKHGLALERSYSARALPMGIVRNMAGVFSRRDPMDIVRAGAIAVGLSITVAGYSVGILDGYRSALSGLVERSRIRLQRGAWRQLR
jgi:glucosyl-dolichyl phosphate glucuronosyltransferase